MLYHRTSDTGRRRPFNLLEDPAGTLLLFAYLNDAKAERVRRLAEKVLELRQVTDAEIGTARQELLRLRPSDAIVEAFERATGIRPAGPAANDEP